MGKVILCVGELSEKPFLLQGSGRKLYSIEEICYYVATNIYGIDVGFFSEDLLLFIEEQLKLRDVAKKLRSLLKSGNSLKDLVTTLLCSSDLYDKEEILSVLNTLSGISTMESWEKIAHIGYRHLAEGHYLLALKFFRKILKEEKISEKDYGSVLMAMGLCLIYTSSYKAASDCFYKAYIHNRTKENLMFTLLSLKLGGLEEEFRTKVGSFPQEDPVVSEVNAIWKQANERAKNSESYQCFLELAKDYERSGNSEEVDSKMKEFKKEYREGSKYGYLS